MQDNFQHLHLCDEEYFVGKSAVNKDGHLFQGECNGCDEPLLIASHCLHGLPPGPLLNRLLLPASAPPRMRGACSPALSFPHTQSGTGSDKIPVMKKCPGWWAPMIATEADAHYCPSGRPGECTKDHPEYLH